MSSQRVRKVVMIGSLAAGLLLVALAALRATDSGQQTGFETIKWKPVVGDSICNARSTLLVENSLWLFCNGRHWLRRIDVPAVRGRAPWRQPESIPAPMGVSALAPASSIGPKGALAIAYLTNVRGKQRLVVAIAGSERWILAPMFALPKPVTKVLGMTWINSATLELAVHPGPRIHKINQVKEPIVIRLTLTGKSTVKQIPLEKVWRKPLLRTSKGPYRPSSYPQLIAALHTGKQWQFLLNFFRWAEGKSTHPLLWVKEDLSEKVLLRDLREDPAISKAVFSRAVDTTAAGLVAHSLGRPSARMARDGSIHAKPPKDIQAWKHTLMFPQYVYRGGVISLLSGGTIMAEGPDKYSARLPAVALSGAVGSEPYYKLHLRAVPTSTRKLAVLQEALRKDSKQPRSSTIGVHPAWGNHVLLKTKKGDLLLINVGTDQFVRVDSKLKRQNPLSLEEHLHRRGSYDRDRNPYHGQGYWVRFVWVLFGWPACLLAGLVFGFLYGIGRAKKASAIYIVVAAFGIIYLISGAICLSQIWDSLL